MYGAEAIFDFGVYVDAIVPFLKDRSTLARRAIRHISMARGIPVISSVADNKDGKLRDSNQASGEVMDVLCSTTSAFLMDQCVGLRTVDLTVLAENGGLVEETLPIAIGLTPDAQDMGDDSAECAVDDESDNKAPHAAEDGELWRQWEWTRALLKVKR